MDVIRNRTGTPVKARDFKAHQGACFDVYFEKARGIYGDEVIPFNAKLLTHENQQVWELTPLEDSSYEKVIDLLKGGMQQTDIAKRLGLHRSTVSRHAAKAKAMTRL